MLLKRYLSDASGAGGTTPPATTPPGGAPPAQDAGAGATPPATPGGSKGDLSELPQQDQGQAGSLENLPEWAQKLIKELRGESAAHRKAKKDIETAAEAAAEAAARQAAEEQGKFKELYEQELAKREKAEAEAKRLELEALKSKVAAQVGVPAALASRLRGETEDEIRVDAQAVLALLPKTALPNDASQGTGGVASQTPTMTPEEIQEFAARMGVDPKYVKPEHFRVGRK